MPLERPQKKDVPPSRPLMPRLAVGASTRSPQPAPKLAQNFTSNGSPLMNRPLPRHEATVSRITTHLGPSPSSSPSITTNVTPRSAARKSRADSSLSTPNTEFEDTPTKPRPLSVAQYLKDSNKLTPQDVPRIRHQKSRSEIHSTLDGSSSGFNFTSPTYGRSETAPTSPGVSSSSSAQAPSFFYANDASANSVAPQRPPLTKKPSSFLYADGIKIEQEQRSPYQNEAASPRLQQPTIQSSTSMVARNPSPQRQQVTSGQLSRGSREAEPPLNEPISSVLSRRQSQEFRSRKASIDSTGHRSQPAPFTALDRDFKADMDHTNTNGNMAPRIASPRSIASPVFSSPSIEQVDTLDSGRDRLRSIDGSADVQSPPGLIQHNLANYSEMAANARRERKVMDLEISNSSLLAINRSLEREVRRQKIEIRRFRRMSRRSYSSYVTESPSETAPNALSELVEESEDGLDEENDIDDDLSENDSLDEDTMSPMALAESDERHLINDRKRLHLDLQKHKELLIDSQKMNQAMRRCLGVTEQLIKDGEKALQYRVLVSDIDIGGRVLSPEEQEDKNLSNAGSELGDFDDVDHFSMEDHERDAVDLSRSLMSPTESSALDPFQ